MSEQVDQPLAPSAEDVARALDALHGAVNFHAPYLNLRDAAAYCGRTVAAFFKFAKAKHLRRQGDGTFARRDLDRVKRQLWRSGRGRVNALRASRQQAAR